MAAKSSEIYEFFTPREFSNAYPTKAKILTDGVLSKYISWVLVERPKAAVRKTYLLMSSSMYGKARDRFAELIDDLAAHEMHVTADPTVEQAAIVKECDATIAALKVELAEYRKNREELDKNRVLASQELAAVLLLKHELQHLIERLNIGNSEASLVLGVFERIAKFSMNKNVRPVGK